MSITTSARLCRAGAGAAVGALVASSLLLTSPAQAVTYKTITNITTDQSETRTAGHNEFLTDGVRVYTDDSTSQAKAAGYFDVNQSLASAGEPSMVWTKNDAQTNNSRPSVQLVVDYNGDGSADGILVGEPMYADGSTLYGNDWWLSNGSKADFKAIAPSNSGGFGSTNHGTLDQWRTAAPNAKILKSGWSLGSGVQGDGVIKQISVGSTSFRFKAATTTTTQLTDAQVDTSATRVKGHNEFLTTGGVRTFTDAITPNFPGDAGKYEGYSNKASGFFPLNESLSQLGEPSIDYTKNSGSIPPGLWLYVDADNDGAVDGILISEKEAYGNDWWLTSGPGADDSDIMFDNAPVVGSGSGSDYHGTLSAWRSKFPDAKVTKTGWSLGAGVTGDFVVNSITAGTRKFTFVKGQVASTIVVTKIGPETPRTTSNLKFTVKVTAPGAVLTGAPVNVKVNQAVIGKGVLASNGTVTVRSNFKFAKGTKTFLVTFGGNASAKPSSTTVKVVIK